MKPIKTKPLEELNPNCALKQNSICAIIGNTPTKKACQNCGWNKDVEAINKQLIADRQFRRNKNGKLYIKKRCSIRKIKEVKIR